MGDVQVSSRAGTPSLIIPMKRSLEDDHTPSVSSPLNPDAAARSRPPKAREQREKKDSLKKRESTGVASQTPEPTNKKRKFEDALSGAPSPVRFNHELPKQVHQYSVRDLPLTSADVPILTPNGVELKKSHDHAVNTRVYRYTPCAADLTFPHMRYYRPSEPKPYGPRMSLEDSDRCFQFSDSLTVLSNEKGWRTGRANICAREGSFYYEVKILQGVAAEEAIKADSPIHTGTQGTGALPHIRMGWARREAPLDSPVGFDGYSYGVTDSRLDPMHKSRPTRYLDDGIERSSKKSSKSKSSKDKTKSSTAASNTLNFAADTSACIGDVIGLEIMLPSMTLHRKIVDGNYNPAVDVGSGLDLPTVHGSTTQPYDPEDASPNIVRDRFPVAYKNTMYFESYDYSRSKSMEAYGDRGPFTRETPSPNHADPTVRSLPHSWIKVYKNGKRIGTAFRNLMAFLPPASQTPPGLKEARQGLDDGMCGYFPAISAFAGGCAEVNFGPAFWCPPEGLAVQAASSAEETPAADVVPKTEDGDDLQMKAEDDGGEAVSTAPEHSKEVEAAIAAARMPPPRNRLRPMGERYVEQIAEDVWYDIIDEVDFYMQDGGVV